MLEIVPFQEEFRQGLPNVTGNVDYEQFRDILERIAELMKQSLKFNSKRYKLDRQQLLSI